MRHGLAADRQTWSGDDAARPLTSWGRLKTQGAARGLHQLAPRLDLIATSSLLRAAQSGEIVREIYATDAHLKAETWPELENADFEPLRARLQNSGASENVLLIGHQPGLGHFAARLLTGSATDIELNFKKSAVCALELDLKSSSPASLLWFAPPRLLRSL